MLTKRSTNATICNSKIIDFLRFKAKYDSRITPRRTRRNWPRRGYRFEALAWQLLSQHKKRAVAFFDGQNLYRHAKAAFGHHHPNFDPKKLFSALCETKGWKGNAVRFYTGVPGSTEDPMWHGYWNARLLSMTRAGIMVTKRQLRYHTVVVKNPDGSETKETIAQEKGIDVRLSLDVVRLARQSQYDVGVIFSQDQDLSEVVKEVKDIASEQKRWIKIVSAYPSGPNATASRGIDGAEWVKLDQPFYDACLDPHDYRPK